MSTAWFIVLCVVALGTCVATIIVVLLVLARLTKDVIAKGLRL